MTTPNVAYEVETTHGLAEVHNPSQMPDANAIVETREPYVKASLIVVPASNSTYCWAFLSPFLIRPANSTSSSGVSKLNLPGISRKYSFIAVSPS